MNVQRKKEKKHDLTCKIKKRKTGRARSRQINNIVHVPFNLFKNKVYRFYR